MSRKLHKQASGAYHPGLWLEGVCRGQIHLNRASYSTVPLPALSSNRLSTIQLCTLLRLAATAMRQSQRPHTQPSTPEGCKQDFKIRFLNAYFADDTAHFTALDNDVSKNESCKVSSTLAVNAARYSDAPDTREKPDRSPALALRPLRAQRPRRGAKASGDMTRAWSRSPVLPKDQTRASCSNRLRGNSNAN